MNILIHAISTNMGGAKRHLDNILKYLDKYQVFVIVNNNYEVLDINSNIHILKYDIKYSNGFKRIIFDNFQMRNIVKEYNIDLIISFSNFGPIFSKTKHILFQTNALYFCKNIKNLYSKKQLFDFNIKKFLIKMIGKNCDLILTPSESFKLDLVEDLNIPEKKVEVLYHAMEYDFYNANKKSKNERVEFVFPSHLAPHKGIHILVDALKLLKSKNLPEFKITCTFDREDDEGYYDSLMSEINSHNLESYIEFIGRVSQDKIKEYYQNADYMIYTTLCESFGFSMLEAKIFKLPAICSDIKICKEISKNAAKYYKALDPQSLANIITEFVINRPTDFDFEDELLSWDWAKYSEELINIVEGVHNAK